MDYFQNQDVARKKTGILIAYFVLAVVAIVVSIYVSVVTITHFTTRSEHPSSVLGLSWLWDPGLFGLVTIGTSALVAGGSLYRIASLSGGGHTVAELLGGRLLHPDTSDPAERKILNVVEEMAIASGVPVPPVYLLEGEEGINAFAAGYAPGDAVIAITSGAVRLLSRDELQGVVAHEFSHILNGDMRLNLRLMGVLFGILLIGLTGWVILRSTGNSNGDDRRKGDNALPLLGLALYIIGYAGVFFGDLIKAAVSRQREYLADASAVQFTRNPDGLAGALKKIGASADGSQVRNPHAEEASHMFFGNAVEGKGQLFGLLATHPPLADRIRRIDPSFDGDFSKIALESAPPEATRPTPPRRTTQTEAAPGLDLGRAIARIGTTGPAQLAYAAALLESLPRTLSDSVRDPLGAQAAVLALLLDSDESVRASQLSWLETHGLPAAVREARRMQSDALRLPPESRLPLVDLAAPALRRMTPAQLRDFLRCVDALIQADRETTLFEYALERLLFRQVVTHVVGTKPPAVTATTPAPLVAPTALVLSALAQVGHSDPETIGRAYVEGINTLGWPGLSPQPLLKDAIAIPEIDAALGQLAAGSPALKKQVLEACAACIAADGRVTVEEGELLRAISDSLGCPMPPLLQVH